MECWLIGPSVVVRSEDSNRRRKQTETLLQIAEMMSAEMETDKIVERIIEASYMLLNAERISFYLQVEESGIDHEDALLLAPSSPPSASATASAVAAAATAVSSMQAASSSSAGVAAGGEVCSVRERSRPTSASSLSSLSPSALGSSDYNRRVLVCLGPFCLSAHPSHLSLLHHLISVTA